MRLLTVAAFAFGMAGGTAWAQAATPHAAHAAKTLTPEQVRGYANGEGMGLAKPAESNAYPGPKHALDLAAELRLTPEQRAALQAEYDAMHEKAVSLGARFLDKEGEIEKAFATRSVSRESLPALVAEAARLQGEIRLCHLEAHLKTRAHLSDDQIATYRRLRGHADKTAHP